jgi:Mn-dependent DtxR family transcriptional regulator
MITLSKKGLILSERYKDIHLTPQGLLFAEQTSRKHHVIKNFLTKILSIDPSVAEIDSCAIEHVISNDSVDAMELFLKENK